jgi:hypothetical protein
MSSRKLKMEIRKREREEEKKGRKTSRKSRYYLCIKNEEEKKLKK